MRAARLLFRIACLALVFAVVVAVAAWLLLRASLPRYDGEVRSGDLSAAVTVERDALGTATFHAANRHDLSWSLGWVHAQERFFEMDLLRRRAAGELAELFGSAALPTDRSARMHRMRARLQDEVARLPADQRDDIAAYRDGVNAGLAALSARPFPYLLTRTEPTPWRSEDTLLVVAAMAFTLNDSDNTRELAFAHLRAALPDSAFRLLAASGGSWDTPITGAPLDLPPLPSAQELDLHALDPALLHPVDVSIERVPGSNSFAVNGALAGGPALIANDMHLDLCVPGLWFRARFVYPSPRRAGETVDIAGASLPGTPAMIVGSNGKVAWGFTNSYADTTDWVRVARDPADPSRYRTADGWAPVQTHRETIHVHGAADDTLDVEETRWGPILAKDADGAPLALAWTAQEHGAFNTELERMETAETVDEGVAIAQASGLPPQNILVVDRSGGIAWTLAGQLPKRVGGYDPRLPFEGALAGTGWDGWLSANAHPMIANPPWQRLWTANQRIVDGPLLDALGDGGYDLGARARQIRDGLRARARFTPADMLAIQLDDRAGFLERWKDLLALELNRVPRTPLHEAMKSILDQWNDHASVDSVAYRLVRAWRNDVVDRLQDGFMAAARRRDPDIASPKLTQFEHVAWKLVSDRPMHLLPPGQADWDAFLGASADRVGLALDALPGGIGARRWGERNTTRIDHPLSRALPRVLARWLDMPHDELPGDNNMPRVQGPGFGASERFAVAPGDEAHGYFMMAGGQSGHPLSSYYGSGHRDWETGTPTPFLPGPPEHRLAFTPAH